MGYKAAVVGYKVAAVGYKVAAVAWVSLVTRPPILSPVLPGT